MVWRYDKKKIPVAFGVVHFVVVILFVFCGWLASSWLFVFFYLLLLDVPISSYFAPIADAMFPASKTAPGGAPNPFADITLIALHLLVGSLWYYLIGYGLLKSLVLFTGNSRIAIAARKFWQTNRR